jgi:hypothetical protein
MHDFQLPPAHAFLGRRRQVCSVCFESQPVQIESEAKLTMEMLEGKPPNLTHVVTFGSPCMVYRKPGKNSLKKRSQRGLILGVFEEVKGFRIYLLDDKKVVNSQHVKYIETLSRAQNLKLLNPTNCSGDSNNDGFSDVVGDTGLAISSADSR